MFKSHEKIVDCLRNLQRAACNVIFGSYYSQCKVNCPGQESMCGELVPPVRNLCSFNGYCDPATKSCKEPESYGEACDPQPSEGEYASKCQPFTTVLSLAFCNSSGICDFPKSQS